MSHTTKPVFQSPGSLRSLIRSGSYEQQTSGQCPGYAQANICILPKEYAFDFLLFATRNPKPCPILHVLEPGESIFDGDIDIRTDLPKYRIFENGSLVAESKDINAYWRPDLVTFVIGCSFSFEDALQRAGMSVRHVDSGRNVPMYKHTLCFNMSTYT